MAYSLLSDIKAYVNVSGTGDDAILQQMCDAAKRIIDSYCGRTFEAPSDSTRYVSAAPPNEEGADPRYLPLGADLCQITSVKNGDGVTLSTSDYFGVPRLDPPFFGLRIRQGASAIWTYADEPIGAIQITGRWAYSLSAPEDIAHCCRRLTAYLYKQRDNLDGIDRPTMSSDGTILLPGKLPQDVVQLLNPYRKRM